MSLVDGGHIILECSNCKAKLVDIWITKPDAPFKWKAKANCCFCGDESFAKTFSGKFNYVGFSKEKDDGEDFDSYVKVIGIEKDFENIVFKTAKGDKS